MKKTLQEIDKEQKMRESIYFNMQLLSYRLEKLKSINTMEKVNQFEFLTYFDASLVSIRALFLENDKKSFSLVNFFEKTNNEISLKLLYDLLDSSFNAQDEENKINGEKYITLKDALKLLTDKFICHHDKNSNIKIGNANYIMSILSNKHHKHYLANILERIFSIYSDALLNTKN
ncbi:hypothetical protein [Sulfurimonas sp.]|uniref:hypothetical protein n=1 Tax=Sulfurimonas sp. TaxID=2022749 RepID=UPI001A0883DB|nr:hypothetical protein [Sulfurimonas sp.]MBE0515392.1 hypothetical protein [Sulfurimonas sp.]